MFNACVSLFTLFCSLILVPVVRMSLWSVPESRSAASAWSTDKWEGLVLSVSKTIKIYCHMLAASVASEIASAAAHGDSLKANKWAELALQVRKVGARLATIADQLYSHELKIEGLSSLQNLAEPTRTEIVSFIYAAGRMSSPPLTQAVTMLRNLFPDDVAGIEGGKYPWPAFFDTLLYDALSATPLGGDLLANGLQAAILDFPEYSNNAIGNLSSSTTSSETWSIPSTHLVNPEFDWLFAKVNIFQGSSSFGTTSKLQSLARTPPPAQITARSSESTLEKWATGRNKATALGESPERWRSMED